MTALFRKGPSSAVAEPIEDVDPEPTTPPVDDDPEPPKADPSGSGFQNPEWRRWEWRRAERFLRAGRARSAVTYTPEQTRQLLEAGRAVNDARAALGHLNDRYAEIREQERLREAEFDSLAERGLAIRARTDKDTAEDLAAALSDVQARLPKARLALEQAVARYRPLVDAADADIARRRAEVPA